MEREIIEVLDKYKNKKADFFFVKEILSILRKYYHAEEYLKKMQVYKFDETKGIKRNFVGFYNPIDKRMYIDVSFLDSANESDYNKNIEILIMILHEFSHVLEEREDKNNTLRNEMLGISDNVSFDDRKGSLHDYIPNERLANILSYMWCVDILSQNFEENECLIHEKNAILYSYILMGYDIENNNLICPLEKLLKESNQYDKYKSFLTTEYPLEERIMYGLPLTFNEYVYLYDRFVMYQNKRDNLKK